MIAKEKNCYLEWNEPFQYKRWKLKNEVELYTKWRFYVGYITIFIVTSVLYIVTMSLLYKYVLHRDFLVSKLFSNAIFVGIMICLLLFIFSFVDTAKVVLHKNGISYFHGGERTDYKYSDISGYKIEQISEYSKSFKIMKLKLNSGENVFFGIHRNINPFQIGDILNNYINGTEQGHSL